MNQKEVDDKITEIFTKLDMAVRIAVKELETLGDKNASEAVFDHLVHMGL